MCHTFLCIFGLPTKNTTLNLKNRPGNVNLNQVTGLKWPFSRQKLESIASKSHYRSKTTNMPYFFVHFRIAHEKYYSKFEKPPRKCKFEPSYGPEMAIFPPKIREHSFKVALSLKNHKCAILFCAFSDCPRKILL